MWSRMTTEIRSVNLFQRFAPRGSLIRFGLAGGFNSGIFFTTWTVSMLLFPSVDVRLLWGLFWGLTGVLGHFVHRWFTFDDRKPVSWTLPTAVPVYVGSLVGSSITIGWLSSAFPDLLYLMGIVNLLSWGVLIWLAMRRVVFQYSSPTAHGFQESQEE